MTTGGYAGGNSAVSDRLGPNFEAASRGDRQLSKGKRCAPAIMLEKDRLHSYLYGPRCSSNGALVLHENWLLF